MTSPVTFPLFPSLPAELRLMIWKFAILMDNRDRLVLLNDVTKRIICTSSLIIPHLQVNVECRHVALGLYPLRLPVSSMIFASRLPENRVAWRYSRHSKGVVFINTDYDRFVLAVDRVGGCDIRVRTINGRWLRPCKGFGWRSSRLSPTQCANIKQIMVFDMKDPEWVTNESSHTPECLIKSGSTKHWSDIWWNRKTWYQPTVFSGVQSILYAVLDKDLVRARDMHSILRKLNGRLVVERLEQRGWLTEFDAADFQEHHKKGLVAFNKCICEGQ